MRARALRAANLPHRGSAPDDSKILISTSARVVMRELLLGQSRRSPGLRASRDSVQGRSIDIN
ncbi:hypothetical protein N825_37420 [Skermanella stibiiresistens SB22]|uniref:Uncharacterized protein n=1 Tax=Skermanella stibiiresistens SB22 TaxID=1385369 RepID=W9GPB9_9PROT|nr:hypothetical protein N825_37420 [Skermanella stibiiresistens SB22]